MRSLSVAALAAAASVFLIGGASAADMPAKAPRVASVAVPFWNWSGFYAGVNLGGSIGDASVSESSSSPLAALVFLNNTTHLSMPGVIGGGQIGYNWQFAPMWLAGIEADFQGTDQKQSFSSAWTFLPSSDTVNVKLKWLGTVRGRLGVVINNGADLWYVTGGLAYGKTELGVTSSNFVFAANSVAATFDKTKTGWTIGGGLESHLFGNWTGKLEYLYVDLGTVQGTAQSLLAAGIPPATEISASADIHDHIIRAGLNYKFFDGPAAPAVASAPVPSWNWSGSYGGVNLGGSIGDVALAESSNPSIPGISFLNTATHMSLPGFIGGGQIGTNWQFAPTWLAGIEADFQGTNQKQSGSFAWTFPPQASSDTVDVKLKWLGTVRGRLGGVTNNGGNLWYVTGGVAYGRTELDLTSVNFIFPAAAATFSHDKVGWTVGGGVESHLFGNWSGKLEYLYVDLGTIQDTAQAFIPGGGAVGTAITASADIRDHIVRAGLNYKFW